MKLPKLLRFLDVSANPFLEDDVFAEIENDNGYNDSLNEDENEDEDKGYETIFKVPSALDSEAF